MRVVLKPIGLILVITAFAVLTWVVVAQSRSLKARDEALRSVPAAPASNPATPSPNPTAAAPAELTNLDFEQGYSPVVPYDTKGKVTGVTASPWYDDSSWAPVTVAYDQDTQYPHGGHSSQKVMVSDVPTNTEARVQFVQRVTLTPGKRYRASCYLRSDRPTTIDIALRQKVWPYHYYGIHAVKVNTTWEKQEVTGTPTDTGETLFMLKVSKPVTFWVDDAALVQE